jgi:DNA-binding MarR family transcriptional regulator
MTDGAVGDLTELDLYPAARWVFVLLREEGPLRPQQLREATGLPSSTLFRALDRLRDDGLVERRVYHQDNRETVYHVT